MLLSLVLPTPLPYLHPVQASNLSFMEHRVRFISFLGIGADERYVCCVYVQGARLRLCMWQVVLSTLAQVQ